MRKYNVIGLGNALVDEEYKVTDDFLAAQSLEKSIMTLLDEQQQNTLLSQLQQQFSLEKRAGGGSAANSMVALSQFGGRAFYCCKVANDEAGTFYRNDLADAGVDTRLENQDNNGLTGKCVVMVTPDAERTMCTYLGITIDFSLDELEFDKIAEADYLYIEGYLVTSPVAREAVAKARELAQAAGTKIALTFSDTSMVKYYQEGLQEFLHAGVDVLFCNEDEAMLFTGAADFDSAMQALLQYAGEVVITRGPRGAVIGQPKQRIQIPGFKVQAIDSNGAGDMFAGAYLYGLTRGFSAGQAGTLASRSAAEIVSNYGPRLRPAQQQAILEELGLQQAAALSSEKQDT